MVLRLHDDTDQPLLFFSNPFSLRPLSRDEGKKKKNPRPMRRLHAPCIQINCPRVFPPPRPFLCAYRFRAGTLFLLSRRQQTPLTSSSFMVFFFPPLLDPLPGTVLSSLSGPLLPSGQLASLAREILPLTYLSRGRMRLIGF